MRIDHYAYQRATRVAAMGFGVQAGIGLLLLVFSLVGGRTVPQDTAFLFGSIYVLLGLPVWIGLLVLFNQHKLERLEALEEDELAAGREPAARGESIFERDDDELRVAARRLRLMHRWLMPILSLVIAAGLGGTAWLMLRHLKTIREGEAEFLQTDLVGWAVAICLAVSALSFIVSRFVAGMAKQPAWQNLRGGAAYMVGNALVTLAIAVGIGFRFFKNDEVMEAIALAIPVFLIVVAIEIALNFVLNIYRPRVPGEVPRPAFDSKLLSLFSAPDNLVRSINEAVNYQFGFDVTSSWGYQLLLRSFVWLLGLGVAVVLVLNMLVIVEPYQQAVKLSRGALVGDDVYRSGILWKLPWPLQTAERYDVTRVRSLHLTGKRIIEQDPPVHLWTDDLGRSFDKRLVPFMVGATTVQPGDFSASRTAAAPAGDEAALARTISDNISLVDAEIELEYRIREDGGLLDYLRFASDITPRRSDLTMREHAIQSLAHREIAREFSGRTLDAVLAEDRAELPEALRVRVQKAFDTSRTGIEVVAVNLLLLKPAGDAAPAFEELSVSHQAREQYIAAAEQRVVAGLAQLVGGADRVDEVQAALLEWERLRAAAGPAAEATVAQRVLVDRLLLEAGGLAAQVIAEAERDRWVRLMVARADANRLRGQIVSYGAAPRLYREREKMLVLGRALPELYKYVLCVDPSRVNFDFDLKELNTLLNFSDAIEDTGTGAGQ